jgi:Reverse transcriptase (RNA-dependent DNA polymerase)
MPTAEDFLSKGYLPKELPPPFKSTTFGANLCAPAATPPPAGFGAFGSTRPVTHNLARPGSLRRALSIPNPSCFFRLGNEIDSSWAEIEAHLARAALSLTRPAAAAAADRAVQPAGNPDLLDPRVSWRAASRFLVVADISQCYPSIYTHSLPWALHSKLVAKARRTDMTLLGNRLDAIVRSGQGDETVGLPIGPDTSHVLAEIVLSACDAELGSQCRGFRYFDDYELYASTQTDASRILERLQSVLADYRLTLNPYKTRIETLPQPLEETWVGQIKRIDVRRGARQEKSDLTFLFDEMFRLSRAFPDRHVVSYGLGRLINRFVETGTLASGENWPYLQQLLLQACFAQPTAIQKVAHVLAWGKARGLGLDRPRVGEALNSLADEQARQGHGSEVAWILWAALNLRIFIEYRVSQTISRMDDDIVALLALHARDRRRFSRRADLDLWQKNMDASSLQGEHWLLAYEASHHGWLSFPGGADPIAAHPVFSELRGRGVRFYDETAQVPMPQSPAVRLIPTLAGRAGYL